jgi:hypothetical protein
VFNSSFRLTSHDMSMDNTKSREQAHQLKKLINFAALFSEVNRELINEDTDKKMRGKRTRRQPITPEFVEVTKCFESLLRLFTQL